MQVTKLLVPIFGLVFTIGVGLLVFDLTTVGRRSRGAAAAIVQTVEAGGGYAERAAQPVARWGLLLTGWEAGLWLLGMWIFGGIITLGLLSFNLDTVRAGDAMFPYLMAGVGYPGLFLVTLLFVWRFLRSLAARDLVTAEVVLPVTAA